MITLIIHWLQDAVESPFGYVRLAGVLLSLVLIPLCVAQMIMSSAPARLYAEGGVTETLSVIFWIGAVLLCLRALFHWHDRLDQLIFKWLCLISGLSAARELDAHILLNPKHFGQYGVRYRIDWFFSNKFEASILLKLMWGAIFIVVLAFLFAPLFIWRKPMIRLIRNGDTAAGLFLLGITALAIGFIFDDILRGTHFMSVNLRRAIEETSEMLGAIFFFGGIFCLLWKPPSQLFGAQAEYNETSGSSRE
jgi:hypothetical protein